MNHSSVAFVFSLVLVTSAASHPASGQQPPVPPQAEPSFRRGLAAAEKQEWRLAADYFLEAYQSTDNPPFENASSPPILFNLGLAYAKQGNDVLASVWLNSYISAEPTAANAEEIRKEIAQREVSAEIKIKNLLQDAWCWRLDLSS